MESIKLKNEIYIDSTGIVHNRKSLDKILDVSYCSMKVHGLIRVENSTRTVIKSYHAPVSVGGFAADINSGKLLIPKGTKSIEITGMICGNGYANAYLEVRDEDGDFPPNFDDQESGVLHQGGGNLYWKSAFPTRIIELNEEKSYEIILSVYGYNKNHFTINEGFGNNSWIQAKKIR